MTRLTGKSPSSESPRNSRTENECFKALKNFCRTFDISMSDEMVFRFACFHSFDFEATREAIIENQDNHYLRLQMRGALLQQFETNTLFPLPGLKTKRGNSDVFCMRPSRYFPELTDSSGLLENLCYILNDMSDTEEKCRNGVAFVANMKGFTMKNYNEDYWLELMNTLQGNLVPARVNLFLIVNPPTFFGTIWKTMKPMLSSAFTKNVHIIDSENLPDYLAEGYQAFLPDELGNGWRSTPELVEDYIDMKMFQDRQKAKMKAANHRAMMDLSISVH
jgi:hypothetical protein